MSHFTVLVAADDEADLENKLAPYHEYESTGIEQYLEFVPLNGEELKEYREEWASFEQKDEYKSFHSFMTSYHTYRKQDGVYGRMTNQSAKWDWWSVGGRWSGLLRLKEGATGRNGEAGAMNEANSDPRRCDVARAGDIDWEAMRQHEIDQARALWQKWQPLTPFYLRLDELWRARKERGEEEASEEEKEAADVFRRQKHELGLFLWRDDEMADLSKLSEEAYVEKYGVLDALTFAYVDDEGDWHERAEMGWWAMTSNPQADYNQGFWAWIKALSPNQMLFLVDAHI